MICNAEYAFQIGECNQDHLQMANDSEETGQVLNDRTITVKGLWKKAFKSLTNEEHKSTVIIAFVICQKI